MFMGLSRLDGFPDLRDEPLVPRTAVPFASGRDLFEVIRQQDVLVHHPFESFGAVVEFIERSADDPDVLAIKLTLYRTSVPSAIITALGRAAQNGKQVTALVELKARFDEQNNILWARALEEAGVHVVYGVMGLKTHCKAALVVRREPDGIRRYVHLSTGNYNAVTARIYTDLGLFTSDPAIGEDATKLFNLLTGYSQSQEWQRLVVAPAALRERVVELIDREGRNAEEGKAARIIVKMNALVEASVIDALYEASQAGVQVDLVIRGTCCLRPGLPGISDNIRVVSIVDKFLEHSRIFYFENDGDPEIFLASADWMPRNFFRRIEVMFPVLEPALKTRIVEEILEMVLADNVKARLLQPDETYERVERGPDEAPVRSQLVLQGLARRSSRTSGEVDPHFRSVTRRRRSDSERQRSEV
jgi:polyphosphate kinase